MTDSSLKLVEIYQRLRNRLQGLVERGDWGPHITGAYQPLEYAWRPFQDFLQLMQDGPKEVLFLGMNPGPHGMAQTGVPFGSVGIVREWFQITKEVSQPFNVHPALAIDGFSHKKQEVSGQRFWGLMRQRFETVQAFFKTQAVHSFCPLLFFAKSGANVTPERLPKEIRTPLLDPCIQALRELVELWKPQAVVALGAWAQTMAQASLKTTARLVKIPHPSPANPNSRNWLTQVPQILEAEGLWSTGSAPHAS
jgi:single-strand selective monofunctional uracil DNA glycosylase